MDPSLHCFLNGLVTHHLRETRAVLTITSFLQMMIIPANMDPAIARFLKTINSHLKNLGKEQERVGAQQVEEVEGGNQKANNSAGEAKDEEMMGIITNQMRSSH